MTEPGIVVIGAGGHAKVVIELLRSAALNVDFCVAAPGNPPRSCAGIPVLSDPDSLAQLFDRGYREAIVAVGDNAKRLTLATDALRAGYILVSAVSPNAVVSPSATIGSDVVVAAGAIINAESIVADHVIVNTGATVDHDCSLGTASHVGPGTVLAGSVVLEDFAFMGAGSVAIPGIRIGAGATVGAGAVVLRDVAPGDTVVGVPARVIASTIERTQ